MDVGKQIGLIGSGGQADEAESYIGHDTVLFRAVSPEYVNGVNSKLLSLEEAANTYAQTPVVAAVGAPGLRRDILSDWPHQKFATIIAGNAYVDDSSAIGVGSIIAPSSVVTTNVSLGQHTHVNIGVTISHDCKLGDFVTVSPGVHIAGKVDIGSGTFIGIGASISNGIKIAKGCVIGAGAVVTEDISTENSVAVGVPAKVIRINEDWLHEL